MTEPRCLLDATAVIAYLRDEKGAETVARLLSVAGISTVNLAETVVKVTLRRGPETAQRVVQDLAAAGLTYLDFRLTSADVTAVVEADTTRALSLGDVCCLATGRAMDLPVVTADTAWPPVAAAIGVTAHLFR